MISDFEKNMRIEVERAVVSGSPQWIGKYMHTTGEYDLFVKAVKNEKPHESKTG